MIILSYVLGAFAVVWVLLQFKTSRPDGTFIKKIPAFRRMMHYIMPGRNESVVYFDKAIRAEKLIAYLETVKPAIGANMSHVLVGALNIALAENPRMNQFVVGRRLYKRDGRYLTFSMKRAQKNRRAKLSAVKLRMEDGETFRQLTDRINGGIKVERSGKKTSADAEFDILNVLPRPLLRGAAALLRFLDFNNILPKFFIDGDGMYTSIFIANLGSLGMAPGFHHLYEYGTCPLFVMAGAIEERVISENGEIKVVKVLPIRFSYDERIDDGLNANYGIEAVARVLEDPFHWLGCHTDDVSADRAMFPHGEEIEDGDWSETPGYA